MKGTALLWHAYPALTCGGLTSVVAARRLEPQTLRDEGHEGRELDARSKRQALLRAKT
jgi:hypothetical protein